LRNLQGLTSRNNLKRHQGDEEKGPNCPEKSKKKNRTLPEAQTLEEVKGAGKLGKGNATRQVKKLLGGAGHAKVRDEAERKGTGVRARKKMSLYSRGGQAEETVQKKKKTTGTEIKKVYVNTPQGGESQPDFGSGKKTEREIAGKGFGDVF